MSTPANIINHIALVLDASVSMANHASKVVQVADAQIRRLATKSKELDQETRVTVYAFDGTKTNTAPFVYDKDVLRLPSIAQRYRAHGGSTNLMDATLLAIEDLGKTPTMYGDHSFLIYVITDGQENSSYRVSAQRLCATIEGLPENWTLAAFVPDVAAATQARRYGFPKENLSLWNTASVRGMEDIGATMSQATDSFMAGRALGVRGYRNLFSMNQVSKAAVQANLTPLHFGQYRMWDVPADTPIAPFVEGKLNRPYRLGEAFYQLTVPVKVQATKQVVLQDRKTRQLFAGKQARTLLGLPEAEVRVAPDQHPDYDIFIQSTSVNRKLLAGQKIVVLS